MTGTILIDSNLLVLLIVGGTSRSYIAAHKNTKDRFDADDFDLLTLIVKDFSDIVLVPAYRGRNVQPDPADRRTAKN